MKYPALEKILADGGSADDLRDAEVDSEATVQKLANAVQMKLQDKQVLNTLIQEILDETGIDPNQEIRRAYDGVSGADYLVQKMISEFILDEHING